VTANPDEPRPRLPTKWVAAERFALTFGVVVFPVLAIALGICITILVNAFR
jgi:hypothetical protein